MTIITLPAELPAQLIEQKIIEDFSGFTGRVGLFGGSFDPIHRVHVEIAEEMLKTKRVDSVVFIPAAQNPLKSVQPTAAADRLAMILLAIERIEGAFVSLMEIERGETSYSIDTIRTISEQVQGGTELCWIIGSDCLPQLPRWRDIEDIFSLASVSTVQRDEVRTLEQWHEVIDTIDLTEPVREKLKQGFVMRRPNVVSATAIRNKIGDPLVAGYVSPVVADYIMRHKLYR